jgi:hypothetical protein
VAGGLGIRIVRVFDTVHTVLTVCSSADAPAILKIGFALNLAVMG